MTAARAIQVVVFLAGCASCSKRLPGADKELGSESVRAVATTRSSGPMVESPAQESNICRIPLPDSLLFSDCVNQEGKAGVGSECSTYRLRDADGRDGKPPCVPGLLALDIDGPAGYSRGALVRGELTGNAPNARVSLRVERITLWPEGGPKEGDTIAHLVMVNSQISALELSAAFPGALKKRTAGLVQGSQASPQNGTCVFTYDPMPSFTECVFPPKTHSSVPDCYEYSVVPVGHDSGRGICVPGEARFRIVGSIGYFREVIVDAEVVHDNRGAADGVLLRVRKISAWPDPEFKVGSVVATLRSPGGRPISLELGQGLRSKTGAKVLKASD
jgi:hypothetical protein